MSFHAVCRLNVGDMSDGAGRDRRVRISRAFHPPPPATPHRPIADNQRRWDRVESSARAFTTTITTATPPSSIRHGRRFRAGRRTQSPTDGRRPRLFRRPRRTRLSVHCQQLVCTPVHRRRPPAAFCPALPTFTCAHTHTHTDRPYKLLRHT